MRILLLAIAIFLSCCVQLLWGCFVVNGDCPNKNVTFWLYTNKTRNEPIEINPVKPLANGNVFMANKTVVILIHGYTGHKDYAPNTSIRPALLDHENVNVISVDYGPLVEEPCFTESVENAPQVSKCVAQLVNYLMYRGIVTRENLHIIGFSLGAQVAGQMSNYVKKKLHHITGLDPAKPIFVTLPKEDRLDEEDADFVDIIHTNTAERGVLKPMGHVDFYPNFRIEEQPGCNKTADPGSCSHNRAPLFYAESIGSDVGFYGIRCDNSPVYAFGQCTLVNSQALMGYRASPAKTGTYFLETYGTSPFAAGRKGAVITPRAAYLFSLTSREHIDQVEVKLERQFVKQQILELKKAQKGQ